jgi:alpha-tubulin suppressor-like RCC1 family protein
VLVQVPGIVSQVAAGSNHTVLLTTDGEVFTVGSFQVLIGSLEAGQKINVWLHRKDNWVACLQKWMILAMERVPAHMQMGNLRRVMTLLTCYGNSTFAVF